MLKFFESNATKVKGMMKREFAVGPMQVREGEGSSFMACDDQVDVEVPAPPNKNVVQTSMTSVVEQEDEDVIVEIPSNVYVLVSTSILSVRMSCHCKFLTGSSHRLIHRTSRSSPSSALWLCKQSLL